MQGIAHGPVPQGAPVITDRDSRDRGTVKAATGPESVFIRRVFRACWPSVGAMFYNVDFVVIGTRRRLVEVPAIDSRKMKRVAILGAGGMGTALALLFDKAGIGVRLWSRDARTPIDLARYAVQ